MPISLSDTVRGRGDLFNSALTSYVLAQLAFQEEQANFRGTLQNMFNYFSQGRPIGQGLRNMNAVFEFFLEELFGLRPPLEEIGPVREIKDRPIDWTQLQILTRANVVMTDEEIEAAGPASLNLDNPVNISQNTTGLDESLGFNTETGQHTVAAPSLSGQYGTAVLGNFNIESGMYNNFGPGSTPGVGATPEGGTPGSGPASAPGAGEQSP